MNTTTAAHSASRPVPHSLSAQSLGRLDFRAMPRILARLVGLALRYRRLCAAAVACAFGSAALNLLLPMLLGRAVDQVNHLRVGAAAAPSLWPLAGLLVGAAAARGTLTGLQGYFGEAIAHRVGHDLRLAFFDKLQQLSAAFHDANHSGDLITRGMLDLEGVRGFLETGALRVISLSLLLGLGVWRLLGSDLELGLLALSFIPFVVWRAARMGILLRLSWQKLQQMMSALTLSMEENLQGQRVVRAFDARAQELARFDRDADAALRLSNQRITLRMSAMSQMNLAFYLAMAAVLWVGGQRVAAGSLSVGLLSECLAFMTLLQQPVRQVGMIVNASARASGAGARLFAVLDAEPAVRDAPGAQDLAPRPGVLRFENVSFAPDGGPARLVGISFELRPGRVLGIVGAPGSGKSTLAQLIPRLHDPAAGRITIDGHDLRGLTLASLRRQVALVQQEAFLFDGSVHDNIVYADPQACSGRARGAAATAQVHDQIEQLPGGYGSRVGERGAALSGGQRQRVTIARALAAKPKILVLDDASSAIDTLTELRLRESLRESLRDCGVVVIAHRLAALAHADEILVLERGRIAERGSHAGLLARGGAYAALWAMQQSGDAKTVDGVAA